MKNNIFICIVLYGIAFSSCIDSMALYYPPALVHIKYNLIDAVKYKHLKEAKQRLDDGCDVNATDRFGFTALHWAAASGYYKAAELLLNRGAHVNSASSSFLNEGAMPLHLAVNAGHTHIVRLLLAHNASVNSAGTSFNFMHGKPLDLAINNGNTEILYYLLKKGAQNMYPVTPLLEKKDITLMQTILCASAVLGIRGLWNSWHVLNRDIKAHKGDVLAKQQALKTISNTLSEKLEAFDRFVLVKALEHGRGDLIQNIIDLKEIFISGLVFALKPKYKKKYEHTIDYYLVIHTSALRS